MNVELRVEGTPGHSSAPPLESPVGILSRAISNLERYQMEPHLEPAGALFTSLTSGACAGRVSPRVLTELCSPGSLLPPVGGGQRALPHTAAVAAVVICRCRYYVPGAVLRSITRPGEPSLSGGARRNCIILPLSSACPVCLRDTVQASRSRCAAWWRTCGCLAPSCGTT